MRVAIETCRPGLWAVLLLTVSSVAAAGATDLRLVDALEKHDMKIAAALLTQKVDVHSAQPDGGTALHWASHWDEVNTAEQLIASGANVNSANDYGVTPLVLAATNGSARMIKALLAAGASPNTATESGVTPLMAAARTGRADAVTELLDYGADPNATQQSKGQTALMWAVAEQHLDVTKALIDYGADISGKTRGGETPLMFAARDGNLALVRLLIAGGADVNESAANGDTPLLIATVRGHVELAKFFLDQGAKPEGDLELAGYAPLHWAAGRFETFTSYNYPDAPGEWRALSGIPNREEKLSLIRALLDHGADVNIRTPKSPPRFGLTTATATVRTTPFYLAAAGGDPQVMRLLLAAGADPLLSAGDGSTPLMAAAGMAHQSDEVTRVPETDYLEAVNLAFQLGNVIDAADRRGYRAIHIAAASGLLSIIQFLADRGSDLNAKTSGGITPLGFAVGDVMNNFQDRPEAAKLLRQLGARSESATKK